MIDLPQSIKANIFPQDWTINCTAISIVQLTNFKGEILQPEALIQGNEDRVKMMIDVIIPLKVKENNCNSFEQKSIT